MATESPFKPVVMLQKAPERRGDLVGKIRRDGVSHLHVLLRAVAMEEVVVGERLESGHLPHGETANLTRIGMNEVVAVLGEVARDRGAGAVAKLHPVPVVELSRVPARVRRD